MKGNRNSRIAACVIVLMISIGLVFSGCARDRASKFENPWFDKWKDTAEKSKGFTPTAKKKRGLDDKKSLGYDLRKELKAGPVKPLPKRKITVKLRDMEVSMVLRAIARAVDQNILINEAVSGKVTVDVKNVAWDDVFTGILNSQNLTYSWEGNIIRIMRVEDRQTEKKRDIRTLIVPIEWADAAQMQKNIQAVLTSYSAEEIDAEGEAAAMKTGTVLVDPHNNALIIQASLEDIQRLLPVIEAIDQPTSQVHIEAHIVEATKETARELGVQWGGLYKDGNQWVYPGANGLAANSGTGGVGIAPPASGWAANFPNANLVNDIATGPNFSLGWMVGTVGGNMLQAQLNALQTDGKLNILSSPSVTTLDNQEAIIESGKEVPFQTVDENGKIVIEWKKATMLLEVTPHVIDGEILKLTIQTKKDELDFTNTVLGNPTILTKNAETNVVLMNGETTVIGGLNRETMRDSDSGIPGLKDIPILGWLFKTDSDSTNLEELLIFITPYVLKQRQGEDVTVGVNAGSTN